jgi:hypothetical protein
LLPNGLLQIEYGAAGMNMGQSSLLSLFASIAFLYPERRKNQEAEMLRRTLSVFCESSTSATIVLLLFQS